MGRQVSQGGWTMVELGLVSESAASFGTNLETLGFTEGAIAGGLLIGASLLAGFAVLQRGAKAFCALLLVASASVLQLVSVGVIAKPGPGVFAVMQGIFGASILVFLTASIKSVSDSKIFGGAVFAAALSIVAITVINLVIGGDISSLMRTLLMGVGGFAVITSVIEAVRGDTGARLILPGVVLAAGASVFGALATGSAGMAPSGLFAIGILGASLVAFIETQRPVIDAGLTADNLVQEQTKKKLRVSENELAEVLDFAGLAIWDWSPASAHQTESFGGVMGADGNATFSPTDFRAFIKSDQYEKFEREVFGRDQGDGGFDFAVDLHSGDAARMRGARAIDAEGDPERIVMFIEKEQGSVDGAAVLPVSSPTKNGTRAAFVSEPSEQVKKAIEDNAFGAAFQPIVSLNDEAVCGYEGLLRLNAEVSAGQAGLSTIDMAELIRAAQGMGRAGEIGASLVKLAVEKHAQSGAGDKFISVNFSRTALLDPKLVDALEKSLDAARSSGLKLVVEITESDRGIDVERLVPVVSKLSDMGVRFALDDFGAGFTRMADLAAINFDYLKIDKGLIGKADQNADARKVVSSLVSLSKDLGVKTIAEGIESEAVATTAKDLGCDFGQGYHFGEPQLLVGQQPIVKSSLAVDEDLSAAVPTGKRHRRRLFGSDLR